MDARTLIAKAKMFGWDLTGLTVQFALSEYGWERFLLTDTFEDFD